MPCSTTGQHPCPGGSPSIRPYLGDGPAHRQSPTANTGPGRMVEWTRSQPPTGTRRGHRPTTTLVRVPCRVSAAVAAAIPAHAGVANGPCRAGSHGTTNQQSGSKGSVRRGLDARSAGLNGTAISPAAAGSTTARLIRRVTRCSASHCVARCQHEADAWALVPSFQPDSPARRRAVARRTW